MPKYHVDLQEIWIQTYEVEAESAEEAEKMVLNGDGIALDDALEYCGETGSTYETRLVNEEEQTE